MRYFGMRWMLGLRLKAKLLVMVLPLVLVPVALLGTGLGVLASREAALGIDKAAADDLEHMTLFTLDLLAAHHQQFLTYKEDKKETVQRDLAALAATAANLVEAQIAEYREGRVSLADAKRRAAEALKKITFGSTGYAYAMTAKGVLTAHPARQNESIWEERDQGGRPFIQEMCREALAAPPGVILHIVYPWKNEALGEQYPRVKSVAYRYVPAWDWIVAVGGYVNETYEDPAFERQCFEDLKSRVKAKKVGQTGYIYALDAEGRAMIHPFREGADLSGEVDDQGRPFIREMLQKKSGWIRYPWKNETDPVPRMKIVRYEHFAPWNWTVAVGSYENEFHAGAELFSRNLLHTILLYTLAVGAVAALFVLWLSHAFTDPIARMTATIRRVRGGHVDEKMEILGHDELGELAGAYNRMIEALSRHRELEAALAQQGKMASLGVLASGVAHEINNPLGVILGYAAYLEKKLDPADPHYKYIQEILRESKRAKKIVQDLLSYSRSPRPTFEPVDLGALLRQVVDLTAEHPDLANVTIRWEIPPEPVIADADPDQLRQAAVNLIFNAAAAMPDGGVLTLGVGPAPDARAQLWVSDTGMGMAEEVRERIFEPFYTTRPQGTGLGLAITRQIVERHRGTIEVDSQPGKGATFRILLPLAQESF